MGMDSAVAVFGGATLAPSVSSSLASNVRFFHLSPHRHSRRTSHLAAFRSASHLFTHPSSLRMPQKPHIFLPHLVASMVIYFYFSHKFWEIISASFLNIGISVFAQEVEETYIMIKPDGVQRGLVRI